MRVAVGVVIVGALGALAWWRVGALDLPAVPAGMTLGRAGLAGLDEMRRLDEFLRDDAATSDLKAIPAGQANTATQRPWSAAQQAVRRGLDFAARDDLEPAMRLMREGLAAEPDNLVLSNAYRMTVFRLKREFLKEAGARGLLTPEFPDYLKGEPVASLKQLDETHKTRETRLALALAWVDHMLLFPALEIKAPSSVEAVNLLTDLIDHEHDGYVPALFARGLNHLHRPARLVWPETMKTPRDAAVQDIGRCIAIGRKLKAGSPLLQATLAMALGDAYVKAGSPNVARSWWQIAQNLARDNGPLQEAVRRRYGWRDEEILDELEKELDRSRLDLDRPMTDLAMMWKE